jgi:hypothetical protein
MKLKSYLWDRKFLILVYFIITLLTGLIIYMEESVSLSKSNGLYIVELSFVLFLIYLLGDYATKNNHFKHLKEIYQSDNMRNLSVATVGAYHVSGAFDFDNTAPTAGSVSINSGASYTKTTAVTLTISANNATEMSICNSSTVGTWIPYSTTNSHTLETTNGNKTVYVWFRDENGNESVYASDTIILDTAAPTISFSANSNATAAKIQSVIVSDA